MFKTRLVLSFAFAIAAGVITGINLVPSDGFGLFVARIVMVFAGLFALAVAILFISTLFGTADDLWDTTYFRYMRAFWGPLWGGYDYPFQISVCRATWLSLFTFVSWLLTISVLGFSVFLAVGSAFNGVEFIQMESNVPVAGNLIMLLLFEILVLVILLCLLAFNFLRKAMIDEFENQYMEKRFFWSWLAIGSVESILILVVAPIRSVGLEQFLYGSLILLEIAITIAVTVGIIAGFMWLINNIHPVNTVPVILAREQLHGWKQKVCPLFIQGTESSSRK